MGYVISVALMCDAAGQGAPELADSVEKLEDVIVRSAEQVPGTDPRGRRRDLTVIFGQEKVIENTLVTILPVATRS